jgi:hypothetical protein
MATATRSIRQSPHAPARVTGADIHALSANLMLGVKQVYVFPAVAGNPVVLSNEPMSLVYVVLTESISSSTSRASTRVTIPPIANRVSDQNTADILRFVRPHWGVQQTTLDVGQVASWRKVRAPPWVAKPVDDPRAMW